MCYKTYFIKMYIIHQQKIKAIIDVYRQNNVMIICSYKLGL